ncbi:TspO/MBR family protein [Aspergillus glaucus CBS 516.65]|uniref:TspO/MBR-related protein n=1 Tax=Aspergillus glaucus CBS 516.65 TaxID=1160497 RepID=A0A1L9V7P5_ASPGL|nr:hypothetical protein ASPGLDRAFT_69814 [Aspergillus glaucus CBS 516.65]OJJ79936.1 hypothetical protein ASPGLDRAFT_69814 [Aspergillus glaucus CBS 516.65]
MPWSFALPQAVFASLILSTASPLAAGMLTGYLVNRGGTTKAKYGSIRQPPFRPPAWLFPAVWTLLYPLMGYAAHHATTTGLSASTFSPEIRDLTKTSQTLYTVQLVFNYLWMPLFFGLRRPDLALADLVAIGGNVVGLLHLWWQIDRTAFWMLVPYASWVGFAMYLNIGVGWLNNWRI